MKQSCALFKAKPNWGSLQASVLPLVHRAEGDLSLRSA